MAPTDNPRGWIGVDLDGTAAKYGGYRGPTVIGDPVPEMAARVRAWLAQGRDVRIFTARAGDPRAVAAIRAWTRKHFGLELPVTNKKDPSMAESWDDRNVAVETNTGRVLGMGGAVSSTGGRTMPYDTPNMNQQSMMAQQLRARPPMEPMENDEGPEGCMCPECPMKEKCMAGGGGPSEEMRGGGMGGGMPMGVA